MILHLIILALVQGLTEFLPISSSGHLVLTHHLLEGSTANLCWGENRSLDVAVHIGTLFSVLVYFRRDLCAMLCKAATKNGGGLRMPFLILLGSLPVIGAGLAVHMMKPSLLCLLEIMAWTTLVFGFVLWFADKFVKPERDLENMNWRDAFIIGIAQCLALIPGVSRSGITMTAARFLGFTRTEAVKFSLFLSIIAISGSGVLTGADLFRQGNFDLTLDMGIAALIAFLAGWVAIALMIKWLEKATFTIFALYRVVLGTALLGLIHAGVLV